MRGATIDRKFSNIFELISTHTPHAGCDCRRVVLIAGVIISTHTPHAGCDLRIVVTDDT